MTVDHYKAARLARRDHHDRNLLAVLSQRREQTPLVLGPPDTQPLVAHVKLVQLEIHGAKLGEDQPIGKDRCVTSCPTKDLMAP